MKTSIFAFALTWAVLASMSTLDNKQREAYAWEQKEAVDVELVGAVRLVEALAMENIHYAQANGELIEFCNEPVKSSRWAVAK